MRVSKHHYALELAAAGNFVYFIEPPDSKALTSFSLYSCEKADNLFIINYKPLARGKRVLPKFFFEILEQMQVKVILKKLNIIPDLIISFDPYRFSNLNWFKAKKSIFFAADLYESSNVPGEVLTADICLGVSPTIVQLLKKSNKNSFFINHGLNMEFVGLARHQLKEYQLKSDYTTLTVGYIGNLLIGALDRKAMMNVIQENKTVKFIFWGQYKIGQDNAMPGDAPDTWEFISFLENSKNVHLAGPKDQKELTNEILKADVFWLCYDADYTWAVDGSNSHKILEYLATGKPVISSFISFYKNTDLLYMQDSKNNLFYPQFFKKEILSLPIHETKNKIEHRIRFALSNSYSHKIDEIDKILSQIGN
jgi:glycosyltransferase involved in cell wall biosynthesis